jgi:hypothetical protein
MPKQTVERVFTRRTFLLFLFLAPAAILTLFAIVLATQYKQLQSVVSSRQAVTPFAWSDSGKARLDTVLGSLQDLSAGRGPDTVRLSASDLTLLAAASPVSQKQRLHFRVSATDSQLIVESTQSIEDQQRRLSWIFQKIVPREFQYLNARLEGGPQWKEGKLEFLPERGFLNGSKVPRAALLKRTGMSPRDFVDEANQPAYEALVKTLDTAYFENRGVVLVRALGPR